MRQNFSVTETTTQAATGGIALRPSRAASLIVALAALLGAGLIAAAAALWVHYGTAVFFEMIKSGIAACI